MTTACSVIATLPSDTSRTTRSSIRRFCLRRSIMRHDSRPHERLQCGIQCEVESGGKLAYAWRVKVKSIRWVGVGTDRVAEMRAFATDVLGLRVAGADGPEFVELATADGSKVELFGHTDMADGPWLFAANPVVVGLLVDDIRAARDELAATP